MNKHRDLSLKMWRACELGAVLFVSFCLSSARVEANSYNSLSQEKELCIWRDSEQENEAMVFIEGGTCLLSDLITSRYVEISDDVAMVTGTLIALPGTRLKLISDDVPEVRLKSDSLGFINIIAKGATLTLNGVKVISFDELNNGPDTSLEDGRAFIRLDAYVDAEGTPRNSHLEMDDSIVTYLGYETRGDPEHFSGYGLSLKVLEEDELSAVRVTGWIRGSEISHNYRGYYSYGARDIEFLSNVVHSNHDYGVDPHDDSTGFIARGNLIYDNGGTGLALSRRCSNSIIEANVIRDNGANGVLVHDLSNNVIVRSNVIQGNGLDGIVVHDSNSSLIEGNFVERNRNGIRLFAGTTLSTITDNTFRSQREASIVLLNGWLEQTEDLSNYSDGTKWNARNISRHNDGRVRGALLLDNVFHDEAIILSDWAEHVLFSGNSFKGGVVFDFEDSRDLVLDDVQFQESVRYRFRRANPEPVTYRIKPQEGAELSVQSLDMVELIGETLYFPSSNPNFVLNLKKQSLPVIVAEGTRGELDIQSGQLISVPLKLIEGEATIHSYTGGFDLGAAARLDISSPDLDNLRIDFAHSDCVLFKWQIHEQFLTPMGKKVLYSQPHHPIPVGNFPISNNSRFIADIWCIRG